MSLSLLWDEKSAHQRGRHDVNSGTLSALTQVLRSNMFANKTTPLGHLLGEVSAKVKGVVRMGVSLK
jgi:hypothetical protein